MKRLERYLLSVIAEPPRPGPVAAALRGFLGGLARLYSGGLDGYLAAEQVGLRRRERLPVPVISIGNLTVGGTGKTPMTQWLCRRLQTEGRRVAILSRGHGGQGRSVRLVSDTGGAALLSAAEAGDEPVLLARTLPKVPVLIGKDRRQSGREALRRFGLNALILDDGFQFWQLARDLDLVLLDARRPFDNGFPLPRGLLREPKAHLRRAGLVVATRAEGLTASERAALTGEVARLAPKARLFFAGHHAAGVVPADELTAPMQPLSTLCGRPVLAACAIAQPESFRRTLEQDAGAVVLELQAWSDHHAFTAQDVRAVQADAACQGACAVIVTEKDAVKWPAGAFGGDAGAVPTLALRIELQIEDEAGFLDAVRGKVWPDAR